MEQRYGSNWEWNEKGQASEGNLAVEITRSGNQLSMFRSGTQGYAKNYEESKTAKFQLPKLPTWMNGRKMTPLLKRNNSRKWESLVEMRS